QMFSTKLSLLKRVEETVEKALGSNRPKLIGGVLVYCAGCVTAISDKINEFSESFIKNTNNIPFLGIATFGEQGCFKSGDKINNLHGNLMCCLVLF
ncbi:MAG: FIST C-terminal domain-containing protein, partial [Candidatus Sericytochromatia bacterium]